jgi:hypothetical protein
LRGIAVNTLFCLATQNQLSREGDVSFTWAQIRPFMFAIKLGTNYLREKFKW